MEKEKKGEKDWDVTSKIEEKKTVQQQLIKHIADEILR